MNVTTIRTNAATILAGVSGIVSATAREQDSVGTTPCIQITGTRGKKIDPGNRRVAFLDVLFRLYVCRIADEATTAQIADDLIDLVISAFETTANSSLQGAVTLAYVSGWQTAYYRVGGSDYLALDFILDVQVKNVAYQS